MSSRLVANRHLDAPSGVLSSTGTGRLRSAPRKVLCRALSSDFFQRLSQHAAAALVLSSLASAPDGVAAQVGTDSMVPASASPATQLEAQLSTQQDRRALSTAPALCESSTGAVTDTRQTESRGLGLWRGWEERVRADPEFAFKVAVELAIGVTATVLGDMSSRPNWGLKELDLVFATLVVGVLINLSLVWLLAPTVSVGTGGAAPSADALQQVFSDHFLVEWGAPGAHMFQPGFSLDKRLTNFAYKGSVFAAIGLASGIVGTALSNSLIALRKRLDPNFEPQNLPPSVLGNAASWGIHMALSANLRYQIINGLDMLIQPLVPPPLFRAYSFLLRSGNNVLGGMTFVLVARLLGVQKAQEPPAQEPPRLEPASISAGSMSKSEQKKRL